MKALFLFFSVIWVSCGPPAKVMTGFDEKTDFSKYQSFVFNRDSSVVAASQVLKDDVINAVKTSLLKKGLRYDDRADLVITVKVFDVDRKHKIETTFYPEYAKAEKHTEGYLTGRLSLDSHSVDEFIEEWCIVTAYSLREHKVIWEAGYVARRDYETASKFRDKQILESVAFVARKYPQ
jgi:hypothetical protein